MTALIVIVSRVLGDGSDERFSPQEDHLIEADRLSFGGQSATLVVGETQASPARLELLLQNAILFDQVGNHYCLLTTDPASERSQ